MKKKNQNHQIVVETRSGKKKKKEASNKHQSISPVAFQKSPAHKIEKDKKSVACDE